MHVRIERLSRRRNHFQSQLLQRRRQPLMDQFHPFDVLVSVIFVFERALEVIQYRQQRAHGFHARVLRQFEPFFFHTPAKVLELRLRTQNPLLQFELLPPGLQDALSWPVSGAPSSFTAPSLTMESLTFLG